MAKNTVLSVVGIEISMIKVNSLDYISLTDIARNKNNDEPKDVVKNWMRSKNTIEFLGIWEQLNNQKFKGVEFDSLLFNAGLNSFTLSPSKWIETTIAIGIVAKQGNKGGTFAHKDIAFEFASWVSSRFKLYLIKEFQRLKDEENDKLKLNWNLQQTLSKVNYHIHTDAIKEILTPKEIAEHKASLVYSSEADILNIALFGETAKQWRYRQERVDGNIRDQATLEQLVVLSNLESINALFIKQKLSPTNRLIELNQIAISQMKSLLNNPSFKSLKNSEISNEEKKN